MVVPPIRCEMAFTTTPNDPNPAYEDITSKLSLSPGPVFTRGRADELATVQAGQATFTLDNTDGQFTAGLTSSPRYPNIKLRKKVRFSVRVPGSGAGNGFADPSFETTLWGVGGNPVPAISDSAVQVRTGSRSMLITWAAGNVFIPGALTGIPTVIGRQYTVSVYVYVPAGNPAVRLFASAPFASGTASAVTNAWTQIFITFTATGQSNSISIVPVGTPTAGQICYVDDSMWDEGPLQAYTTNPLIQTAATPSGVISYRFTGYMDEWPVEWPGGGFDTWARCTAVDRFKRLGNLNSLRSLVEQEYLSDSPFAYYTLGEPTGSTTIGDTSKNGRPAGSIAQLGTLGTATLGSGVGPTTCTLPAAVFVPSSTVNGKYFNCPFGVTANGLTSGQTLECFFNTSTAAVQSLLDVEDAIGRRLMALSIDASGHLVGSTPFLASTIASSAVVSDGKTHHAAITQTLSGGSVTVTVYLDGVVIGNGTWIPFYGLLIPYSKMNIGGSTTSVFNGTVSHAACYDSGLSIARILDHVNSGLTGFSGERSDQRIARLARYCGIPTAEQSLEVGLSTSMASVDTAGAAGIQAMQDVTSTESGILQVDGQGRLASQSRSHRYNTTSAVTLAGVIDPGSRFVMNDLPLVNDVTASRPNGIVFRAVNAQSVLDNGPARITPVLLTTSDNEVIDAANWKSNSNAIPAPRLPTMLVDITAFPSHTAAVLALDISSRASISLLPSQAPASSLDQFVEGWTEVCDAAGWVLTFNTSPASTSGVWQLDSAIYSQLDVSTRLAY